MWSIELDFVYSYFGIGWPIRPLGSKLAKYCIMILKSNFVNIF